MTINRSEGNYYFFELRCSKRKVKLHCDTGNTPVYIGTCTEKIRSKGTNENNDRSGRSRLTDKRGDRKLFRLVKYNRPQSLQDIISSFNRTEPVSVRQFVKVYTGKDTKCGTSRKLIQYFL